MNKKLPVTFLLALIISAVNGQLACMDTTFGPNGLVNPPVGNTYKQVEPRMLLLPDGKIIVREIRLLSDGILLREWWIHQFLPDGVFDNNFGVNGSILLNPGDLGAYAPLGDALQILPSGKILTACRISDQNGIRSTIIQLNADGSFDTTFGTNGRVIFNDYPPLSGLVPLLQDVVSRSDGKTVLIYHSIGTGYKDYGFRLLEPDGSVVGTTDSIQWKITPDREEDFRKMIALPDNELIICGSSQPIGGDSSSMDISLIKLNGALQRDSTFGTNGEVTSDITGSYDNSSDVQLLPDGKFLVCGLDYRYPYQHLSLARFGAGGTPDPDFGNNGTWDYTGLLDAPSPNQYYPNTLLSLDIFPNQRFVVSGSVNRPEAPWKEGGGYYHFNANGASDTTVNPAGVVWFPDIEFNTYFGLLDIKVLPDERILACGTTWAGLGAPTKPALARFLPQPGAVVWYQDLDGDGYGNDSLFAAVQPQGYAPSPGDCDDQNAAINPGATEICDNTIDDNCNGLTDEDNQPPVAVCIDNLTVTLDDTGLFTLNAALIDNGSTDNCGILTTAVSPAQFSVLNLGNNTVTLTVTDASGNENTCLAVVEVTQTIGTTAIAGREWLQLSPNPAKDQLMLYFSEALLSGSVHVDISDQRGRMVVSQEELLLQRQLQQALDIYGLPAGNYYLRVIGGGNKIMVAQFSKM